MAEPHRMLGVYLHLAQASQSRMQPMVRDKLLVLAGVQAEAMGLAPISALCRHKVLAHNAQHMLGDWPTLAAALGDERFRTYLKQLMRRYSKEKAEHMLDALGIELGRERQLYSSDLEYAAALLATDPEAIQEVLERDPGRLDNGQTGRRPTANSQPARTASLKAHSERARRVRGFLVVWGPFLVGASVLALAAVLLRTIPR